MDRTTGPDAVVERFVLVCPTTLINDPRPNCHATADIAPRIEVLACAAADRQGTQTARHYERMVSTSLSVSTACTRLRPPPVGRSSRTPTMPAGRWPSLPESIRQGLHNAVPLRPPSAVRSDARNAPLILSERGRRRQGIQSRHRHSDRPAHQSPIGRTRKAPVIAAADGDTRTHTSASTAPPMNHRPSEDTRG